MEKSPGSDKKPVASGCDILRSDEASDFTSASSPLPDLLDSPDEALGDIAALSIEEAALDGDQSASEQLAPLATAEVEAFLRLPYVAERLGLIRGRLRGRFSQARAGIAADDIMSEVLIGVANAARLRKFEGLPPERTNKLIEGIAKYKLMDAYRKGASGQERAVTSYIDIADLGMDELNPCPSAEELVLEGDFGAPWLEALQRLAAERLAKRPDSSIEEMVVILASRPDISYAEMRELGVTGEDGTLRVRVNRALRILGQLVTENFLDQLAPGALEGRRKRPPIRGKR